MRLLVCCAALSLTLQAQGAAGGRHALVIGISGCLSNAVQAAAAPCLQGLAASGTVTWTSFAGGIPGTVTQPTLSGPGWTSVLTGMWSNKHHVVDDAFAGYVAASSPLFFARVKSLMPSAYLSSIVEWTALDTALITAAGTNCDFHQTATDGLTTNLAAKAVAHLAATNPTVLFLAFDAVEIAGKASGFSTTNAAYLAALAQVDAGIQQVLNAVRARPSYASEQWLIMVTSDHGGSNTTCGGQSPQERTTFTIVNGPGITPGRTLTPGSGQTCIPPTVMTWLGLSINPAWGFDSPLFGLPLTNNLAVYLNFDNTLAASGGTTNSAAPYGPNAPHYTNGMVGFAAAFTNTESVSTAAPVNDWAAAFGYLDALYVNDFTIAMWTFSANAGGGAFAGNKDWTNGGYIGWVVSSFSRNVNWCATSGNRQDVIIPSFSDNRWHHVAVSFLRSANRVTTYFDGVAFSTLSVDSNSGHDGLGSLGAGYYTLVGASGPMSPTFAVSGKLDEFGIWTRALDAGEVAGLCQHGQLGQALTNELWPAPLITIQPISTNVGYYLPATLGIAYTGVYATCQWYLNGVAIPGANSTNYSIPQVMNAHAGNYSVSVGNNGGTVTSTVATLTVQPRPYAVATNGLVVHLPLNGNLSAAPGTTVSGSVMTGTPHYVAGPLGLAASFTNNYQVTPPNDWAVSLGNLEPIYSNNFTVALWVRSTNTNATDGALISNKNWTFGIAPGWVISLYPLENVNFNTIGQTRRDFAVPLNDGSWHHVTFAFDRTNNLASVYLDGTLRVTNNIGTSTTNSLNGGFPTVLGADGTGASAIKADLDDLGIWNRVLTLAEIRTIYLNGLDAQTVETPLTIRSEVLSGNQMTLGWVPNGFWLQSTTNLTDSASWTNLLTLTNSVTTPIGSDHSRFYRLTNTN